MMKLIYQPLGTKCLVGIQTTNEEERMEQYYSFWNHGATSGKLIELGESFHYITTSPEQLEKYFLNSSLAKILTDNPDAGKGEKGGALPQAEKLAEQRMNDLTHERWVHTTQSGEFYTRGTIAAERLDPDS